METYPTFTILENFVSAPEYAKLCKVERAAIYDRYKKGRVSGIVISGKLFIDKETSPPIANVGRNPPKAPPPKLPPDLPPVSKLMCLVLWGYRNSQNVDDFLTDILFGRLRAWGIGGQVVIEKDGSLRGGKLLKKRYPNMFGQ